jgi:hypothetical protein
MFRSRNPEARMRSKAGNAKYAKFRKIEDLILGMSYSFERGNTIDAEDRRGKQRSGRRAVPFKALDFTTEDTEKNDCHREPISE